MKKTEKLIKLAQGNSKIHGALIWNIRARQTCPGATEMCKKVCYAKGTEDFRKADPEGYEKTAKSPSFICFRCLKPSD